MPWKQWVNQPKVRGVIISAFLVVGVVGYLHGIRSDIEAEGERVPVVVTVRAVSMNHLMAKDDVAVVMIPKRYRNPVAASDVNMVIGHVALINMASGEHVTSSTLSLGASRLSSLVPKHKRLVAIALDSASMLPVKGGDLVDLIATSVVTELGTKKAESLPVLERIPVMDVETDGAPSSRSVIYGLMTPDQALRLMTAQKQGVITAIVRPMDDVEMADEKTTRDGEE